MGKTVSFMAPKSWRIVWSCDPSSKYDFIIHASTTSNALLANSVETTCSNSNAHGITMMHQAGDVYLVIISEGSWIVQVEYAN
jgi:hypothetical protein